MITPLCHNHQPLPLIVALDLALAACSQLSHMVSPGERESLTRAAADALRRESPADLGRRDGQLAATGDKLDDPLDNLGLARRGGEPVLNLLNDDQEREVYEEAIARIRRSNPDFDREYEAAFSQALLAGGPSSQLDARRLVLEFQQGFLDGKWAGGLDAEGASLTDDRRRYLQARQQNAAYRAGFEQGYRKGFYAAGNALGGDSGDGDGPCTMMQAP